MTRRSIRSLSLLTAIPLLGLSLAACSFSFKAGSKSADDATARPAPTDGEPSTSDPKPVATADPKPASEPEPPPPAVADEPEPTVEPAAVAVCRVEDAGLAEMCHFVFDPIAANDTEAWAANLNDSIVVTRPSHDETMHRMTGPSHVKKAAAKSGGLRALMHLNDTDRVVGTLANDCRDCRRSFVAFQANTRSGTIVVRVETSQPPKIAAVDITSRVLRPRLGKAKPGGSGDGPSRTLEAPKDTKDPAGKTAIKPASKTAIKPAAKTTTLEVKK